jgi:hypothetical protein
LSDINFTGLDGYFYPNHPNIVALTIVIHLSWRCEPKLNPSSQFSHIYRIYSPKYPSQDQLASSSEKPQKATLASLCLFDGKLSTGLAHLPPTKPL